MYISYVCNIYLQKAENPAGKCPSGVRRGRSVGMSSTWVWMPVTELDSAAAAAATGVPWRKEKAGMCSGKTGSGNVGLTADGLLTAGDAAGLWGEDRVDEDQQFYRSRPSGTKVKEHLLQGL